MSEPDIVQVLGAGAALLRETATGTTPGDWDLLDGGLIAWQDTEDQRYEHLVEAEWENGADLRWAVLASPALASPLASLLEDLRRLAVAHPVDPGYAGMPEHRWCAGCQDEECDALQLLDRAREVVQTLNGSASDGDL